MGICTSKTRSKKTDLVETKQPKQAQDKYLLQSNNKAVQKFQPIKTPLQNFFLNTNSLSNNKQLVREYEIINRNNLKLYSVGQIQKSKSEAENQSQIQNLSAWISINHPNLQKWQDIYEEGSSYLPVKEKARGYNFIQYVRQNKFTEVKFRHLILKIMMAVRQLHLKGIVHNDLRSETIIFQSYEPDSPFKIITLHESKTTNFELCKSPESLRGESTPKSDVWSLGVLIFLGFTDEYPFNGKVWDKVRASIIKGDINFADKKLSHVSTAAKELLKNMLNRSQEKRFDLLKCMRDSWFSQPQTKLKKKQLKRLTKAPQKIQKFSWTLKIQKAAMLHIILKEQAEKNSEKLYELFTKLDSDLSGTLSRRKLSMGYSQLMSNKEANDMVDQIFQIFDTYGSGKLYLNDFLLSHGIKTKFITAKNLGELFDEFDVEKRGIWTFQEVRRLTFPFNMTDYQVQVAIEELDPEGTNGIPKNRFVDEMLKILKKGERVEEQKFLQIPQPSVEDQVRTKSLSQDKKRLSQQPNKSFLAFQKAIWKNQQQKLKTEGDEDKSSNIRDSESFSPNISQSKNNQRSLNQRDMLSLENINEIAIVDQLSTFNNSQLKGALKQDESQKQTSYTVSTAPKRRHKSVRDLNLISSAKSILEKQPKRSREFKMAIQE